MKKKRYQDLLEGVREAVAIESGERQPERVYDYPMPDVRAIRDGLKLSQGKFAAMLGISKRTLEGWEQGRRQPTGAARRLLEVAARFPDEVYTAIFERTSGTIHHPDGSVTEVVRRPGRGASGTTAPSLPKISEGEKDAEANVKDADNERVRVGERRVKIAVK